jgi:NADPH-dependent curcumin reductase CurA
MDIHRMGEWIGESPEAIAALAAWFKEGALDYRASIAEGLDNAPRAFIEPLRRENSRKQLADSPCKAPFLGS